MEAASSTQKPRREKQQISVPFHWEEKPGFPKQKWMQEAMPTTMSSLPVAIYTAPSHSTQAASIPFRWEERPGKPLESFDQLWSGRAAPVKLLECTPRVQSNNPFMDHDDGGIVDSSLGYFPCADDGSSFFPSSSHEKHNSFTENSGLYGSFDSDTESENYLSSSSSNDTTVANASVLDLLFPMSSPDGGFLSKSCLINGGSPACNPLPLGGNNFKKSGNLVVRRTMTLGELIMLSRKLSCMRRSTIPSQEKNPPMEFLKKLFACF